jgi:hypothetical protein
VAVLCVQKNRASVVANAVPQAVVNPCLDHITVVQTSDGRRNKTTQTDVLGCREAGQVEPGLVELNLLGCITVGCVVQCLVREGVGDMGKGVAVGGRLPPDQQRVVLGASRTVCECGRGGGPDVSAASKWFLKFESSINLVCVLNGTRSAERAGLVGIVGGL